MFLYVVFVLGPILLYLTKLLNEYTTKTVVDRHVVITGGSSGIGKALAVACVQQGAHVTIVARNQDRLQETLTELLKHKSWDKQVIKAVKIDCTIYNDVETELLKIDEENPIYMLVNCAGMAICGTLDNMSVNEIKQMIDINYYATVFPTKVVIPLMKRRKEGVILLTGSQCSIFGLYGYSAYSAAKYALRGLAESIYMELKDYNITVTLGLPADTNTPGYENENKTKPEATKLISESGGIYEPEQVAEKLLYDALEGNFFSTIGFESWITKTLCMGMSPVKEIFDLVIQSIFMGPLRLLMACYLCKFKKIVTKCHENDEKKK